MEKKEGLLFLSLFLLAILIVSVSATITTCYVTSRSSCLESQGNDIILGLSDSTNAHAEEKGYDDENVCYGTATACTNLYSESSCTTQEGCSWHNYGTAVGGTNPNLFLALTGNIINGVSGYCTNDPGATACPTYTGSGNQLECENQRGCSWEIEYNSVLCCNSDSEIVPAECTPGKYLLQLSSATNAHTEGNDIGTYSVDVCSKHKNENADCVASNINPENPGWSSVLSLSGLTNAHVGGPGELEYDLWCPLNYGDSILPEFYCGDEDIQRPNSLDFYEECEESLGSANCDYGNCVCAEEYEFIEGSGCNPAAAAIGVYWAYPLDSQNPISGGIDWNNEINSSGRAYPIQVGTSTVWLAFRSTGYGPGTSVEFNIYDKDLFSGDDLIKTLIGVVDDNGDVSVDWTITQYDLEATGDNNLENFSGIGDGFYFKVEHPTEGTQISEDLKATVTGAIICDAITMCMDYRTQNRCDNDALFCNVAAYSVNQNSPGTDCSDPDIGCSCTWTVGDIDECNSYWGVVDENGFAVGGCTYNQDSSDTCADNFLEYSWTGDWAWDTSEGNLAHPTQGECEAIHPGECTPFGGSYYYDPGFKSLECTAGSNVVPCPAKIQLSFFNTYNLIITLVLIIIIYLIVISLREKTKTKSRKKK